jgi:capsular exopolysaccharide synthesis family protein
MGSMLEIMKQVREENGAPNEPAAVEGIVEPLPYQVASSTTQPAGGASRFAEPASEPAREPSRFAALDVSADSAGVTTLDTQEWNPKLIDPAVVAFHARYSIECEQFRSVRARLLTMNGPGNPCVLAVTSSLPGEGKSACTLNLGLVVAEGGEQRTLIVDADFRRASITRMLGLGGRAGLSDVIRGTGSVKQLLCPTPLPNLKTLPAGGQSENRPCDLLGSGNLRQVFAELRDAFDYVFVDMPPVNTVSDTSVLAPLCNAALLVLEMRRTPEPVAQQAVRTLQANNVRVVGCIVTRHSERPAHAYGTDDYYYRRT